MALPRPSNIAAFLHISSQMGVSNIILTNAAKVQADYFGSHLLRPPQSNMREALKAGMEQAGDVALPKVHVARRLKPFLEDDLDRISPNTIRIVAHPQKEWLPPLPSIREVKVPRKARLLVAVGPEAGWDDPFELDLLAQVFTHMRERERDWNGRERKEWRGAKESEGERKREEWDRYRERNGMMDGSFEIEREFRERESLVFREREFSLEF